MIPERAVCSPTALTRTRRLPPAATVPATTVVPGPFETPRDSPVISDSSTSAVPPITFPSARGRHRLPAIPREELFRVLTPLCALRCPAAARPSRRERL